MRNRFAESTSKKGVTSLQLAEQLGVTQKKAWSLNNRVRAMLTDSANETFGDVVQIDETFVGSLNKNRHADKKHKNTQGARESLLYSAHVV